MDEVKSSEQQARGSAAQALLESESFTQVVSYIEAEYYTAWLATKPDQTGPRENLWHGIQVIARIKDHLKKIVANGRLASKDLAEIKYLKR